MFQKIGISFISITLLITPFFGNSQEVKIKQVNCRLEEETLKEISIAIDMQISFYRGIFNDTTKNSFSARVFGTRKEYIAYSKSHADYNPNKTDALAFYSNELNEMILHLEIDDFVKTFKHELNHAMYEYYCQDHPVWLTEGLSEFMENIEYINGSYGFDVEHINAAIRAKSYMMDGATIKNTINNPRFYRDNAGQNYTLSWAIVYYLYTTNKLILDDLIRNACGDVGFFVIDRIYPGGLELLQSDMKSFFINYSPKNSH